MKVAVIKYNAGNTASVLYALERLGVSAYVTDDADKIWQADKVILPGVGEASTAMAYLSERNLDDVISSLTQPVLGICLGMQLMCSFSEENDTPCLGVVSRAVRKITASGVKVPHTGWNTVTSLKGPIFDGVADRSYVYFVHGYAVEGGVGATAETQYGQTFCSAFSHENFHAVQFHPERSGAVGERILENFLKL